MAGSGFLRPRRELEPFGFKALLNLPNIGGEEYHGQSVNLASGSARANRAQGFVLVRLKRLRLQKFCPILWG
jgi:hypothetical protein